MFAESLHQRGFSTIWLPLPAFLEQVQYGSSTLLAESISNPFAVDIDPTKCRLSDELAGKAWGCLVVDANLSEYSVSLAHAIQAAGLEQPNSPATIQIARNKWASHLLMESAGLSVARGRLAQTPEEAHAAAAQLGYPLVVKELMSMQGRGVRLAKSPEELERVVIELDIEHQPVMVQHYIECHATDKRVVVIDGKIVASMERHAKPGDFRANLALGGTATPSLVAPDEEEAVLRAVRALDISLVGMDIARVCETMPDRDYLTEGDVFCIEANSFPGLKGLHQATGVDASGAVIEMLMARMSQRQPQWRRVATS